MRRFAWILGLTHLFVFVFVAGSLLAAEAGTASSPPAASAATIPAEPKVGSPVVAPRAADLVKDFLDAHVGAELGEVMPTNGTGRFRLTKPTSARQILDGGGRPIGYFFRAATLEYDIDPADEPVVDHNLRFVDGLKAPEKGKPLRIEAKEIAWLSLEGPAPDPGKAVVEPPNETLKRALDPRSGVGNPATEFAAARLSGNAPLVAVFAKIGDERYVAYGFDAELGREGIAALELPRWKLKGREDWLQAATIDERPVGRARQSIDPFPAEVRGIDIRIVEGTGEMGEVTATVDYGFLRHYPALLKVAWMDEGLDYRNPGLVRRFPAEMKSITDAEGHPLPYAKQRDSLLVQLPHRMKPGEVVRLKFAYTLPLIQYGGDRYWRLGEQPWYPMAGGDLRRNAARIRAEVHARKPFTAWGTGRVVKRWEEGEFNCVILEELRPADFPVVGAGAFFPYEFKDAKGRSITVVSYAMERPEGQARLAKLLSGLVDYYEAFYPKYPFDYLTIVEANDWGFGQAPAGYINITKEAFNPLAEEISQMYSRWANDIFAHEIGHAWWGHYFRAVSAEDQWLEESFAEYSCALVLDWTRKKGDMERKSREWKKAAEDVDEPIPIVAANRLSGREAGRWRQRLLYNKGPWVLHCLRSEMGEKPFFVALKAFLQTYDGRIARTEDFVGIVEAVTKKDWHPWFDRYVYGAEMPELAKR